MAAAFHRAGFTAIDVHMSDLLADRVTLANFQLLVACGGFLMVMYWVREKAGQNQFYSIHEYMTNSLAFLLAQILYL